MSSNLGVMSGKLPKLVVFDLDYTLWPFWIDTHVRPPFEKRNGIIYDSDGSEVTCYPESTKILEYVKELGCDIAVASRTGEIEGANQLIELLGWNPFFKYKEIYPGSKRTHFQKFKKLSNLNYEEMIFFDDEQRNICEVGTYHVYCVLVKDGMTLKVLQKGLKNYILDHT